MKPPKVYSGIVFFLPVANENDVNIVNTKQGIWYSQSHLALLHCSMEWQNSDLLQLSSYINMSFGLYFTQFKSYNPLDDDAKKENYHAIWFKVTKDKVSSNPPS